MSCPVCLKPLGAGPVALTGYDVLFETTPKSFRISGCSSCGCRFIDPLPGAEELAGYYPTKYWWKPSSGLLKRLEGIYRKIVLRDHVAFIERAAAGVRRNGQPVRILDVGCGSATLLGLLKTRGFAVRGFDSSAEASAIAKEVDDVDVVVGMRLQEAKFAAASFDVVTLFHVMEHVTEPREVLAEVRRIVRPGGRLVLQVPNIDSWQFQWCGVRWYGLDVPRHVINYSNASMRGLLETSGFALRRTRHFNIRDNAPALASSMFPSLDPVSRGVRQHRRNHFESVPLAWARHALYLTAVLAAYPFALAEAAVGRGATLTIEAEKV